MILETDDYSFELHGRIFNCEINFAKAQKHLKSLQEFTKKQIQPIIDESKSPLEQASDEVIDTLDVNLQFINFVIRTHFDKEDANFILKNASTAQLNVIKDLVLAS